MLGLVKSVLFGPLRNNRAATYPDLGFREVSLLAPLVILMFWIGFYPRPLLSRIEPAVTRMLEAPLLQQARIDQQPAQEYAQGQEKKR
jgi:NADH-quinone oxidoreductase subunit M